LPQERLYQAHNPEVPKVPPLRFKVTVLPMQTDVAEEESVEPDISDKVLTLIVTFEQGVVLQVPSALTK